MGSQVSDSPPDFQPSAGLTIKAQGGTLVLIAPGPSKVGRLFFRFDLFDSASGNRIWIATSALPVEIEESWKDTLVGVRFATNVASQLRDDGVLQGCPSSAAGWPEIRPFPGCQDERREALAKAMQESSDSERARLIASAPTCE